MATTGRELPESVIAVYSGGLDSTVMLADLLRQGTEVRGAATFDYGQRHRKEIKGAAAICQGYGIAHRVVDLTSMTSLFGQSSLTNENLPVPEGHYEEESMKATIVPNRNMILIAIATAWAVSEKVEAVAYAAHSGDHAIYPDCRNAFADALDQAIQLCDWHTVSLYRPFVNKSKAEIVALGDRLGAPLAATWSCYNGREIHCGRCGTCVERREAFRLAGVSDPTQYESEEK